MELTNATRSVNGVAGIEWFQKTVSRPQRVHGTAAKGDTVTISPEGFELARAMWATKARAHASPIDEENDTAEAFIPSTEGASVAEGKIGGVSGLAADDQQSDVEKQLAKLEKQIHALQERLEEIYSSDMPDSAKEATAKGINDELNALLSQKTMLTKTQIADQAGAASGKGKAKA